VTDEELATGFLRTTYLRRVDHIEEFPWGELVVTPSLSRVYDANFAIVSRWDGSAGDLETEMQRVQAAAGFAHRKTVIPRRATAEPLWDAIERQGWDFAGRYVLMAHRRPADRAADPGVEVVGVGDVDWAQGRGAILETEGHGSDPEVARQLLELDRRLAHSMDVRHLAGVVDGKVVSYAGLYLEDGVAQIEDVATLPSFRNRGLARAVVLHAVEEAYRAGAQLVFLVADEADWPRKLYERLGFDWIGLEHVFGRSARQHSSA